MPSVGIRAGSALERQGPRELPTHATQAVVQAGYGRAFHGGKGLFTPQTERCN